MAETEAKLRDIPRAMTRRREQVERNLAAMEARYEAAAAGAGRARPGRRARPAAARDDGRGVGRSRGHPGCRQGGGHPPARPGVTILPGTRRQGASRLPFEDGRVQISESFPLKLPGSSQCDTPGLTPWV